MLVAVAGRHMEVGESLRAHVDARLSSGMTKYIDRITAADVVVSKEAGHKFRVDIAANTGTHANLTVKSRAEADDAYAAFDAAADKIEKQLRRYKRKITNHHRQAAEHQLIAAQATKYVLEPVAEHKEQAEDEAPVIIAEKATQIARMTVGEAVMQMDLQDLPALMFLNSGHGRLNVVYRRADGNISWVDPQI